MYALGTLRGIAVSVVSRAWKQQLRTSGMGTSIKNLQRYILFNKDTLIYEILPHRNDWYPPSLSRATCEVLSRRSTPNLQSRLLHRGFPGPQDLEMRYFAYKLLVSLIDNIDNNIFYSRPSFYKLRSFFALKLCVTSESELQLLFDDILVEVVSGFHIAHQYRPEADVFYTDNPVATSVAMGVSYEKTDLLHTIRIYGSSGMGPHEVV